MEQLHLVDRFTRVDAETITDRLTVEDPTTWTQPWTAEIPMTTIQGPLDGWACHEENADLITILRGARVAEQEAAQKAVKPAK